MGTENQGTKIGCWPLSQFPFFPFRSPFASFSTTGQYPVNFTIEIGQTCGVSPSCRSPWLLCHAPMPSRCTSGTIPQSSASRSPAVTGPTHCRNAVPKSPARHCTMWYVSYFRSHLGSFSSWHKREREELSMQSGRLHDLLEHCTKSPNSKICITW